MNRKIVVETEDETKRAPEKPFKEPIAKEPTLRATLGDLLKKTKPSDKAAHKG